jgi:hypothetical protein
MTREEAVALLERYSNYDGMGIPNLAGCKEAMKVAVESLKEVYPELRESEDERIRKEMVEKISNLACGCFISQEQKQKFIAYLEKQKEPHYTKRNALFDKCVAECDPEIMQRVSDEIDEMLEKEQKPTSTEDMPYITDEHFYEREPVDSFKYKLAEYMTKCCTKKEGPYGYEYGISAETILKMAEEELLKRGVVQKPAEWSDEDEDMLNSCISSIEEAKENRYAYKETDGDTSYDHEIDWLKSLRPSWKPSEEQKEALEYVIRDYREDSCNATANYLQEILDHLKNM